MRLMHLFLLLFFYLLPCIGYAQAGTDWVLTPADTDKVEIDIRATFNGNTLVPGKKAYVNAHGDTFYVDAFRFYITNFAFAGSEVVNGHCIRGMFECDSGETHLYDLLDTNTYSFVLKKIPPAVYRDFTFTIGIDSFKNTSGANGGDLDPTKGMYWAWNSGYIMAKLEGHSKVCKTLHNAFEFHIGGYMPPNDASRRVSLPIPEFFEVGRPSMPTITLNADIAAWFNGIDLSKVNSILTPGKEAMMMADNYAKMFTIESVDFTPLNAR